MSTQTLTLGSDAPVVRPPAESVDAGPPIEAADAGTRKARAGLAMSIATFAMAAASAIQAILYLGKFGTNARTDGFFVAFALYSVFGVFSQSLRVTSVPLLVEPGARLAISFTRSSPSLIERPSMVVIMSPALRPALSAGPPG